MCEIVGVGVDWLYGFCIDFSDYVKLYNRSTLFGLYYEKELILSESTIEYDDYWDTNYVDKSCHSYFIGGIMMTPYFKDIYTVKLYTYDGFTYDTFYTDGREYVITNVQEGITGKRKIDVDVDVLLEDFDMYCI